MSGGSAPVGDVLLDGLIGRLEEHGAQQLDELVLQVLPQGTERINRIRQGVL